MHTKVVSETLSSHLCATFRLRDGWFALDAALVLEVIRVSAITTVAHSPVEVVGVINLRGRIVTLLDIGLLLGLGSTPITAMSRVFVVEDRGEYIGLLVDQVGDVRDVQAADLQPPPANVPDAQLHYLTGVYRADAKVISLLNARLLVAGAESASTCN